MSLPSLPAELFAPWSELVVVSRKRDMAEHGVKGTFNKGEPFERIDAGKAKQKSA